MKQNKRFIWMIASGLLILSSISCKKFLDRKPLTATLPDVQAEQGALEGQSLGLYYTLRSYGGFSSLPWIDFHSIRGDDAAKGSDANDGKEIIPEFEQFQYTKDDWATDTYWNDHFTMINLANAEIHVGDSLKTKDPATLRQMGEAHFFRAYSFFELVKAYGEVPLINYYYVNPADGVRAKSSVDDIYAQIDKDLDTASQYLPLDYKEWGNDAGFPGRLTSGAANTLWAQTFLFRKNWARVVGLCNTVINSGEYTLLDNFTDIWKDGVLGSGKNSSESIFEMQCYEGQNGATISAQRVTTQDGWGTAQQVRQNGAPVAWNLGWGWNVPTQALVDAWDDTDPRKNQTILYSGQFDGGPSQGGWGATLPAYSDPLGGSGLAEKYWNKKAYTGNDPAQRTFTGQVNGSGGAPWINHRILRLADVYLMLAEASNEAGDGATAESALEIIRNRASGNLGPARTVVPHIAYANQAQMRTAIKNERLWEFALEGYRFYDLVRWTPATDGIDAPTVLGGLGYSGRNQYYPIPQPAIDISNGVLKQNPNY